MKHFETMFVLVAAIAVVILSAVHAQSQEKPAANAVEVHLVITDEALDADKELPQLQREDIKVKQGKKFLKVTQLIPAQGDNAALQLMILIDDTLNSSIGNNLNDLKEFIAAQPPTTLIGIGYMANAGVNVVQQFTADHALAVKAVRLPRGSVSTMDSPYLSLISLVKGWTQQKVRREILMVTDGIDRLRGERPQLAQLGPDYGVVYHRPNYGAAYPPNQRSASQGVTLASVHQSPSYLAYESMPSISIDARSASEVSQRYNVIVYSLYSPGIGRAARSSWDLQLGLSGLSQIADETGAECFSLSTSQLVSFKPYLERLQKMLSNQYYVVFQAVPRKKASFQRVNIQTELSNSEIESPDNVWVPAINK
ncbi:MAG TPA: hypothetical protein VG498_01135 [Terriglobales bacterium]|nr:hypothetical protein [Terriglobales bacterium]